MPDKIVQQKNKEIALLWQFLCGREGGLKTYTLHEIRQPM